MDNMKGNPVTDKTLGPVSAELLLRLSAQGKTIFSVADAQAIIGKHSEATAKLSRMAQRRWLVRLMRGKYLIVPLEAGLENIPMVDRYVIAHHIVGSLPYYISHYSALELHQITTHPLNTVHIAVRRQRVNQNIAGVEYRFVYANKSAFWGFESFWATDQQQVQVSDLEKTLLDCAARPELCGGLELAKGLWIRRNDLNQDRLAAYARRLNQSGHQANRLLVGDLQLGPPRDHCVVAEPGQLALCAARPDTTRSGAISRSLAFVCEPRS